MKHYSNKIFIFLLLALNLASCVPAVIFTGIGAPAMIFSKDRTPDDAISDLKLASLIKTSFMKQNFTDLYAKINIEVFNNRVMVTGHVDYESDKEQALSIINSHCEVREVIDEIKVQNGKVAFNFGQYTKDSAITAQIKSKTFVDKEIKGRNFIIVTHRNIVYMLGVARSEEELKKVAQIAANVNGVEKVVSYVSILDKTQLESATESKSSGQSNAKIDDNDDLVTMQEIESEWEKY